MLPFELTKDNPYLALSGEIWSVFYEYLNRNWSCYKGFLLYIYIRDANMVIAVSADAVAPHCVMPSAGTMMTAQLHIISEKFFL